MIATARCSDPSPPVRAATPLAAEGAGKGAGLVEVVEAQLERDPLSFRPHPDLVAERLLELVAGLLERRLDLGIEPRLASSSTLAGQPAEPCPRSRGPTIPPSSRRGRGGGGRRCRSAPRIARPWPSLSSPASSIASASSGSSSRRIRLEIAGRLRPTRRARSSLESFRSVIRASQARASSTGFRSSRTMFSISAACSRSASAWSRTTAGTFARPACWAARQRRSPATSS